MDFDMDLDLSSWPFDAISLLSPSPPPSPPPPWLYQDGALCSNWDALAGISQSTPPPPPPPPPPAAATGNFDINEVGSEEHDLHTSEVEEISVDTCRIREKLTQALRYLKDSAGSQVLAQVWAPVKNGDRYILTTSGQPFVLDPKSFGLLHYRTASIMYVFSVNGRSSGELGLPGRVFVRRMPEWTPNVQYYSSKEYPRLNHAVHYNVQGSLALPVFEPSVASCVGVVELIMTSQKVNYAPDVDKVCKALEAVNLKSYNDLYHPSVQIYNEGRQSALAEILEVLTTVCEAYALPLAQTWVPCRNRHVLAHGGGFKKNCSSFDGSCMGQVCMSTSDVAVYIVDAHMWRFRDACVEHHLQKGQGVAGRAFELRSSYFSRDITQFCKVDYPLVHYARMFKLVGCLAVCLQSVHTGTDDYILEFFLPPDCKETSKQQSLLDSLLASMKKCFRSLKICDDELQEGNSLEFLDVLADENHEAEPGHSSVRIDEIPSQTINCSEKNENFALDLVTDVNADENGNNTVDLLASTSERKVGRKRGKAEKSISIEVLRQYFSGSLKDAAKSLGVCPTTMKRICRQHGISRWPSRKINKVNRSLSNLKRVMESVQGAEGAFDLQSLACPIPDDWKGGGDDACNELKPEERISSHLDLSYSSGDGNMDSPASPESKTVTIKASYKEDRIRFRVPCGVTMLELNDEVAKRLKLEIGTFEIKFLDNDDEWVILACDADLEECLEIVRLSGVYIIRLLVRDVAPLHGSSCESSD